MPIEKFENRLLRGNVSVTCVFQDKTVRRWTDKKENVVANIRRISEQYAAMGYRLTLRQLHYQMVAHDPNYVNHDTTYKKLGKIIDDCRYAGVVDWGYFTDRGRRPSLPYTLRGIKHALTDAADTFRIDLQRDQPQYVEVWTEKDALSEIMEKSTSRYHVRLCVNKGYTSSSAMYDSYKRISRAIASGQGVVVLYFGDHDPSGLDMVRDIRERMELMLVNGSRCDYSYGDGRFMVRPIGLTMKQIKQYKLPANPTKMTDTRAEQYVKAFGKTCWEVDALAPPVLTQIVESNIESCIDIKMFNKRVRLNEKQSNVLSEIAGNYDDTDDPEYNETDDDDDE